MDNGYTVRRDDAAACLAVVLLDTVYHHGGEETARQFVTDLCKLLSDQAKMPLCVLAELIAASQVSFFALAHWLYTQIERCQLQEVDVWPLLGRYGAQPDVDNHLVLTRPGDGYPVYFTGTR